MRFLKLLLSYKLLFLCILLAFAASGNALTFVPADNIATGLENNLNKVYNAIAAEAIEGVNSDTLLYSSKEEGLNDSYETDFASGNATITYTGGLEGPYISGAQYLLALDDSNKPNWYLFALTAWDGMQNLVLSDLWTSGAISFVSIHGGEPVSPVPGAVSPVPEPATMLLLGTGLIGLAGVGRKKFNKKS